MTAFSAVPEAIILAGGKGTRLASRLGGLPKPLVSLAGVPLLERQLLHCKAFGIASALVLVNHRAKAIEEFCATRDNFGLRLTLVDDGEPRGTAGAVFAALPRLLPETERVLILYGDTLLNIDLRRFISSHLRSGADATLLLHPNDHPQDSDLVELDAQGFVARLHPYPHSPGRDYPNLVNAALYCVQRQALEAWREGFCSGPADFAKDVFPVVVERGARLCGYVSPEYIKDVGTPERLEQAEADLASGRFTRGSLCLPQVAVFLDRDGVLNEERGYITRPDQLVLLPGAAAAVRRLNRAGLLVVVVSNQPVVARGECTEEELRAVHARLDTLLGREGAYIDRLYYCPHHPDKGFPGERADLKLSCDCRKPGIGMLLRAAEDLHIDLARSRLVGDRTGDLLAAQRAGVIPILVRTGAAGLDGAHPVEPCLAVDDLPAAADVILRQEAGH